MESNMLRRGVVLAGLLVLSTSRGDAQSPQIKGIQIVERGVYHAETVKRIDTPGTTGVINTVRNLRLISSTSTVLGQIGVRFGVVYVPLGDTPGVEGHLKLVITFPPGGLRNPETHEIFFRNEHMVTVPIGSAMYWEYQLENQWEIVSGVWVFSFWHQDRKLAEQRFCVHDLRSQGSMTGYVPRECAGVG